MRPAGGVLLIGMLALASCDCRGGREGTSPAGDSTGSPAHGSGGGATSGTASHGVGAVNETAMRRLREMMVDELVDSEADWPITDPRVIAALRSVPRHEFVPEQFRGQSYQNTPLPIPESQTISQPYIVALMTQLLELKGTEKVLEVGTGSGYQAAILGELAGEVYTVEIREVLLDAAKKKLEELKRRGVLHYKRLVTVLGDGSRGYKPAAPYDAVIITAAPRKVPVEILNQLKPGGRVVVPVGGDYIQELQLIVKNKDGSYVDESIVPVRFGPLVGEGGEKRQ